MNYVLQLAFMFILHYFVRVDTLRRIFNTHNL